MVTLFAWIAHRLQSSKRCTRKSSVASCSAITPSAVQRKGFCVRSLLISRTCMSKANRSNALSTKGSSCRLMQTLWRLRHHAITGHATPLETTKATGCSHGRFHDLGPLLALTVQKKKGLFGARTFVLLRDTHATSMHNTQVPRTSLANGSFLNSSSVDFWYLRISRSATVPGLYLRLAGVAAAPHGHDVQ